jgi:Prealbumin-like fold domain
LRLRKTRALSGAITLALVAALAATVIPASASHPEVSLPGSDFEIDTDANLKQDDPAPSQDWATIPQGAGQGQERRKADLPTGSGDDSFGQGAKEDTLVPTVVDGSIPPNKSDLTTFGGYLETTPTGERFLNIYWHRVQDPSGTTNMDFEFNQGSAISANGVTPTRTAGDVLIQYDLSQGGVNPQLFLSRWVTSGPGSQCVANNATPCWGNTTASGLPPRVNLTTAGLATGSINTTAIPAADADGLGAISPRTFGEAQIDFDALAGEDECVAFGSAYLKSRSSDSFTAALKDFIAPLTLNFSLCGSIHVIKHDDADPAALLDGAEFDLREDNPPVGGSPGAEDTTVASCTTVAGVCDFATVQQGEYWVVETVAPVGHDLADPAFQAVTVDADEQATVTFVDPRQRGAILVTKTAKHAAAEGGTAPQAGVNFTIAGTPVTTNADGQACVDGLLFGSYDVVETVPAGYVAEGDTTKSVTVDNKASCADDPYGGESVAFVNVPLTNVTVSVDSQVDGGTASTVECVEADPDPDMTTGENGDGELALSDLAPQTLTCTIVIDP